MSGDIIISSLSGGSIPHLKNITRFLSDKDDEQDSVNYHIPLKKLSKALICIYGIGSNKRYS
jgi:hypothetical protein